MYQRAYQLCGGTKGQLSVQMCLFLFTEQPQLLDLSTDLLVARTKLLSQVGHYCIVCTLSSNAGVTPIGPSNTSKSQHAKQLTVAAAIVDVAEFPHAASQQQRNMQQHGPWPTAAAAKVFAAIANTPTLTSLAETSSCYLLHQTSDLQHDQQRSTEMW